MKKTFLVMLAAFVLNGCITKIVEIREFRESHFNVTQRIIKEQPIKIYKESKSKNITLKKKKIRNKIKYGFKPPSTISLHIEVVNGKVDNSKIINYEYPGQVQKTHHHKLRDGRIKVFLRSTYNPKIQWSTILPQGEGDHLITARRID